MKEFITYQGKKFFVKHDYLTLENLDIQSLNQLKGLENMNSLRSLNLSDNHITSLKDFDDFPNLNSLHRLHLNNNHIESIYYSPTLQNLGFLSLKNCPLLPPKDIDDLKSFFKIEGFVIALEFGGFHQKAIHSPWEYFAYLSDYKRAQRLVTKGKQCFTQENYKQAVRALERAMILYHFRFFKPSKRWIHVSSWLVHPTPQEFWLVLASSYRFLHRYHDAIAILEKYMFYAALKDKNQHIHPRENHTEILNRLKPKYLDNISQEVFISLALTYLDSRPLIPDRPFDRENWDLMTEVHKIDRKILKCVSLALQKGPLQIDFLERMYHHLFDNGKYDLSASFAEEMLKLEPKNEDFWWMRALALKHLLDASNIMNHAELMGSNLFDLAFNKEKVHEKIDKLEKSINESKKAIRQELITTLESLLSLNPSRYDARELLEVILETDY